MNPKVGIVVVNWNKPKDIINMLDCLQTLEYDNHEIFVVDNASSDDSVEKIKKHALKINLLVNNENLGGTGGFNSGIRFALKTTACKYVWLLDNDATVTPTSLKSLIDVMENDPLIGLAGSRVLNADNPEYVVETGAMLDWVAGTVRPVERNVLKTRSTNSDPIEVDYVAVCSALARVSALADVGLMDERYFLFWDDMDWGIAFKQAGYKVVAVPGSEIFHAAFTEYRSVIVDSYYGVRNQLLTFSKYRHKEGACLGLFHQFRRISKSSLLMVLCKKPGGKLGFLGCWDFFRDRWGKIPWEVTTEPERAKSKTIDLPSGARILVVPTKDVHATIEVVNFLIQKGASSVDVIVPKDRKELFSEVPANRLILVDYFNGMVVYETFKIFLQIMRGSYDLSVKTSPEKISPFSYAIKMSGYFETDNETLVRTEESRGQIWQVIVASLVGEMLGLGMFALSWIRSFSLARRRS